MCVVGQGVLNRHLALVPATPPQTPPDPNTNTHKHTPPPTQMKAGSVADRSVAPSEALLKAIVAICSATSQRVLFSMLPPKV